jgi:uncharacterized membrane-anchored protein YhcB (DUF1043 family)
MSEDTIKLAYLRRREQELDQILKQRLRDLDEQRQQITALAEERARLLAEIAKDNGS